MTETTVPIDPTDPGLALVVWVVLDAARPRLPARWRPWIPWLAVVLAGVLRGLRLQPLLLLHHRTLREPTPPQELICGDEARCNGLPLQPLQQLPHDGLDRGGVGPCLPRRREHRNQGLHLPKPCQRHMPKHYHTRIANNIVQELCACT
jgi:hypothetical protein